MDRVPFRAPRPAPSREGPGKSEPRKRVAVRPSLGLGSTNVRVNFRRQKLHAPSSAREKQHVIGNGAKGPSSGAAATRLGPPAGPVD
ncbi:hypothetical protein ACLOJK_037085 [Asimina triloba]